MGLYPPFLPSSTGCSAGSNARFVGPGEQEEEELACVLRGKTSAPVTVYALCTEK